MRPHALPTNMAAADVAAVEGRGYLALCQPLLGPLVLLYK